MSLEFVKDNKKEYFPFYPRYQPSTEDIEMYRLYTDKRDKLHDVDRFMMDLCQVPQLRTRLDLTLTLWEFPAHYLAVDEVSWIVS